MKRLAILTTCLALLPAVAGAETNRCRALATSVPASLDGQPVLERVDTAAPSLGVTVRYDLAPPDALAVDVLDPGTPLMTEEMAETQFFLASREVVAAVRDRGDRPAAKPVFHRFDVGKTGGPVTFRMVLPSTSDALPERQDILTVFRRDNCIVRIRLTLAGDDPTTSAARADQILAQLVTLLPSAE